MQKDDHCASCGQPIRASERRVRDAIRYALDQSGMTQVELAERAGVTQKHISQVLSGKSGLSFDFAERLLGILGRRLDVKAVPIGEPPTT